MRLLKWTSFLAVVTIMFYYVYQATHTLIPSISDIVIFASNPMTYPIMWWVSSFFNKLLYKIQSLLNFIVTSTFITTFDITHDVPDKDDARIIIYIWFKYFLAEGYKNNDVSTIDTIIETTNTSFVYWYDDTTDSSYYQLRQIPGTTASFFWFQNKPILYMNNTLITYCLPWNRHQLWLDMTNVMKTRYKNMISHKQKLYKNNGPYFNPQPILVPVQKFDDPGYQLTDEMQKVVYNLEQFLKPSTRKYYEEKGFTYYHRIFTHGPPGTGKSQLAIRLAGEFNLPLYYINCENIDDSQLEILFDSVQRGIIFIEEIDNCIHELVGKANANKNDYPQLKHGIAY